MLTTCNKVKDLDPKHEKLNDTIHIPSYHVIILHNLFATFYTPKSPEGTALCLGGGQLVNRL